MKLQSAPRLAWLLTLAGLAGTALAFLIASGVPGPMPELPPPPGASQEYPDHLAPEELDGAHAGFSYVFDWLRDHYEVERDHEVWYRVSADTTWDSVKEHYAAVLGPDWEADDNFPEVGGTLMPDHRARMWSNGDHVVAIFAYPSETGKEQILFVVPAEGR